MRVERVLLTADAIGGVWPYAIDLGRGLAARGLDVHVAVMGPPPSAAQREEAAAAAIALTEIPRHLEWMDDPWDDVDAAGARLLALEREVAPDVVHVNGFCHAALPWRAPVVAVAHSCVCSWWRAVHHEPAPPRIDAYRTRVVRGLRAANAIIAPSFAMLRQLQREYGPLPRAVAIPNGSAFRPLDAARREPLVLSAGRLWDEAKNVAAVCAAAPLVPWPIWVAGDCRDPDGRTVAPPAVHCLGQLSRHGMREWYARASIYALPARYEPFGLSVLEAARAGCALVLGDIASLRENWSGAAVFVPPDDRHALVAALDGLIGDGAERRRLAAAASARAARFTVERMVDGYLAAYARLRAVAA